jgi:hypothetical protein
VSKHRCTDPKCAGFDRPQFYKRVDKHKLQIVHVNDGPNPFAYTVGAWKYRNLPELFIALDTGGNANANDSAQLGVTLGAILMQLETTTTFEDGTCVSFNGVDLYLRDVKPDPRSRMGIARDYYLDRFVTRLENVPVFTLSVHPKPDDEGAALHMIEDLACNPLKTLGALLAFVRKHYAGNPEVVAVTIDPDGHAYIINADGSRALLDIVSLLPLLPNAVELSEAAYPLRAERPFTILRDGTQRTLPIAPDEMALTALHRLSHDRRGIATHALRAIAKAVFAADGSLDAVHLEFNDDGLTGAPDAFYSALDSTGLDLAFEYATTMFDLGTMKEKERNIILAPSASGL